MGAGYYLGESKYHGWIIQKEKLYGSREQFIERYALTANGANAIIAPDWVLRVTCHKMAYCTIIEPKSDNACPVKNNATFFFHLIFIIFYSEQDSYQGDRETFLNNRERFLSDGERFLSGGETFLSDGEIFLSGGEIFLSDGKRFLSDMDMNIDNSINLTFAHFREYIRWNEERIE